MRTQQLSSVNCKKNLIANLKNTQKKNGKKRKLNFHQIQYSLKKTKKKYYKYIARVIIFWHIKPQKNNFFEKKTLELKKKLLKDFKSLRKILSSIFN